MRLFRRKAHRAAVYDTRPLPDDPDPFDRYVIALCEFGWVGEPRDDPDDARADALRHTADVDDQVKRPLG